MSPFVEQTQESVVVFPEPYCTVLSTDQSLELEPLLTSSNSQATSIMVQYSEIKNWNWIKLRAEKNFWTLFPVQFFYLYQWFSNGVPSLVTIFIFGVNLASRWPLNIEIADLGCLKAKKVEKQWSIQIFHHFINASQHCFCFLFMVVLIQKRQPMLRSKDLNILLRHFVTNYIFINY